MPDRQPGQKAQLDRPARRAAARVWVQGRGLTSARLADLLPADGVGKVERFAEPDGVALLPVTLRNVETALAGKVNALQPSTDADMAVRLRSAPQLMKLNSVRLWILA